MEQAGSWKIVRYRVGEKEPPKYAVLRDGRRMVWGLRDKEAAGRWLSRLSRPAPFDAPAARRRLAG